MSQNNFKTKYYPAFSLAEMMVVMLIFAISLAAFAPSLTRRIKAGSVTTANNLLWELVGDESNNIFYKDSIANDSTAVAQIGTQLTGTELDNNNIDSRLLITTTSEAKNSIALASVSGSGVNSEGVLTVGNTGTSNQPYFLMGSTDSTPGSGSVAIGRNVNAQGNRAVAIGENVNAPSSSTLAIGWNTITTITSPSYYRNDFRSAIAIGEHAMAYSYNNRYSVAIGNSTMSDFSGLENVAIGSFAMMGDQGIWYREPDEDPDMLHGIDTSVENYYSAGHYDSHSNYEPDAMANNNIAVGYAAMENSHLARRNVAIGYQTLLGTNKFKIAGEGGYDDGDPNTDDDGTGTGYNLVSPNNFPVSGVDYGDDSGGVNGSDNVAIGAMPAVHIRNGNSNISIGRISMMRQNNCSDNIVLGRQAFRMFTSSLSQSTFSGNDENIAIGHKAMTVLGGITSATPNIKNNIAIGRKAMEKTPNSSLNIAIGHKSLYNAPNVGEGNIAIGGETLKGVNGSSSNNIGIGLSTFTNANGIDNNIAIGYYLGESNGLTGDNNIIIGRYAAQNLLPSNASDFIMIGSRNGPIGSNMVGNNAYQIQATDRAIFLGTNTDYSSMSGGVSVSSIFAYNPDGGVAGNGWSNASTPGTTVVMNGNLIVKGYTYARLRGIGVNDDTGVLGIQDVSGISDNIQVVPSSDSDLYDALNTVALKTGGYGKGIAGGDFTYTSDRRLKNIQGLNDDGLEKLLKLKVYNYTFKNDNKKLPHVGVIAQDLEKIFPNAVIKGEDGYLRIRWDEMFYAMVNSLKKLAAKVTGLEAMRERLEKENAELRTQNQALEQRLIVIENKLK